MNRPTVIRQEDGSITLTATLKFEGDLLEMEEQIQETVNELGLKATLEALSQHDTDGSAISVKGQKMTTKGRSKKS